MNLYKKDYSVELDADRCADSQRVVKLMHGFVPYFILISLGLNRIDSYEIWLFTPEKGRYLYT